MAVQGPTKWWSARAPPERVMIFAAEARAAFVSRVVNDFVRRDNILRYCSGCDECYRDGFKREVLVRKIAALKFISRRAEAQAALWVPEVELPFVWDHDDERRVANDHGSILPLAQAEAEAALPPLRPAAYPGAVSAVRLVADENAAAAAMAPPHAEPDAHPAEEEVRATADGADAGATVAIHPI